MELKPCPFTGREARIDQGGNECFYGVAKGHDQVEGPVRETYEAAVIAWNTRVEDARVQLLAKALRQQTENMAFILNRMDTGGLHEKFETELYTAMKALAEAGLDKEPA